jgi:hypothetical protein
MTPEQRDSPSQLGTSAQEVLCLEVQALTDFLLGVYELTLTILRFSLNPLGSAGSTEARSGLLRRREKGGRGGSATRPMLF